MGSRNTNERIINKRENILSITFSTFFYATCIVDIFRLLGQSFIPFLTPYVEVVRNIIYIFVICMVCVFINWFKIKKEFLITLIGIIILLGISLIINSKIVSILIPFLFYFISRCLTGFYLAISIKNFHKILVYLDKFKGIMFIYTLLIIFVYSNLSGAYSESSYMAISYNLLQIAIVILISGKYFGKKYYYIYHIYLVVLILIYGARGTLVCLAGFYFVLYILTRKKKKSYKELIYTIMIMIISGLVIINIDKILNCLESKYSFSRNLSLINAESLFDYGNRILQYNGFLNEIYKEPMAFRGLLSDRFLMGKLYNTEVLYNLYPHNIILEVIYQNGLVIGMILLICLIILIFVKIMSIKNKYMDKYLFVIFVPIPLINLMISGSYLISYTFWMALGYLLNRVRGEDREKGNN